MLQLVFLCKADKHYVHTYIPVHTNFIQDVNIQAYLQEKHNIKRHLEKEVERLALY